MILASKTKYFLLIVCLINISCKHQSKNETDDKEITQENVLTSEDIEQIINEENTEIDSIGILVYDGFFDLDAIGPYSVLSNMVGTDVFFVSEKKGTVKASSGIEVSVSNSIDDIKRLDILVVPGGLKGTVQASKNENILSWVKKIDEASIFTVSVCTGAWILGEAGILKNKTATANWYRAKEKIESYGAKFTPERYVRDGKLWTSAGVSAGIDMSLALIAELKGETYAKLVMLNLEYDPKPPLIGGSVENTNPGLVDYMTRIYDATIQSK